MPRRHLPATLAKNPALIHTTKRSCGIRQLRLSLRAESTAFERGPKFILYILLRNDTILKSLATQFSRSSRSETPFDMRSVKVFDTSTTV